MCLFYPLSKSRILPSSFRVYLLLVVVFMANISLTSCKNPVFRMSQIRRGMAIFFQSLPYTSDASAKFQYSSTQVNEKYAVIRVLEQRRTRVQVLHSNKSDPILHTPYYAHPSHSTCPSEMFLSVLILYFFGHVHVEFDRLSTKRMVQMMHMYL